MEKREKKKGAVERLLASSGQLPAMVLGGSPLAGCPRNKIHSRAALQRDAAALFARIDTSGAGSIAYQDFVDRLLGFPRHLSQHGPGDPLIAAEARCLAVHGNPDCDGAALAPGLSTNQIRLCDAVMCPSTHASQSSGLGALNLVTVGIADYAWSSAVQWVVPDLRFNTISVTLRAQL
jgi:hypothetical protein